MRAFLEEREREALLILITMLGVAKWWLPSVLGFQNIYVASQWVLSYDHGLIRRGLVGTIMKLWVPIVTIGDVQLVALIAFCVFLAFLLVIFYALLRYRDEKGQLFRLIVFFLATPATISLLAHNLGRFDLFLTMILFLSMTLLSLDRHAWLLPILMVTAMLIHESFIVLYAPTISAAIIFVYLWNGREKRMLVTLVVSVISVIATFFILYEYGSPTLGYEEFSRLIQSRAAFQVTPLSIHECYFSIKDHYALASSSLYDAGSLANLFLALLILSPAILILLNLWVHVFKSCGPRARACRLFFVATLSGLLVVPIATDYGRWLSAIMFCNFVAIFFFVSKGIVKIEDLAEYTGGSFKLLFVSIIFTYLLFGPFHDWNPYPYQSNVIVSSLAIIAVLLFDVGFFMRWRALGRVT